MTEDLVSWQRTQFEPGGGDPMLFFAIYGTIKEQLAIDRAKHRSNGTPSGIRISRFAKGDTDGVYESFLSEPFGSILDEGFPELSAIARAAPHCMVIKGTVKDPATLDYLRDVIGMIACMIDAGGVALLDVQTLQWWDAAEWRREVFEADFDPAQHVTLMGSVLEEEGNQLWLHTRGMKKFGRPDLSIHRVADEMQQPVVEACNLLIARQALGAKIPEGEVVETDGIPAGTTCHHGGHHDDPDFNNVHLEIRLPTSKKK